jgi:mersacidin/lichenicidin family type 2 lantibiotic
MSQLEMIRAWKDEEFRSSLSAEQQALLPENPAGQIELSDDELELIEGATASKVIRVISHVVVALVDSIKTC